MKRTSYIKTEFQVEFLISEYQSGAPPNVTHLVHILLRVNSFAYPFKAWEQTTATTDSVYQSEIFDNEYTAGLVLFSSGNLTQALSAEDQSNLYVWSRLQGIKFHVFHNLTNAERKGLSDGGIGYMFLSLPQVSRGAYSVYLNDFLSLLRKISFHQKQDYQIITIDDCHDPNQPIAPTPSEIAQDLYEQSQSFGLDIPILQGIQQSSNINNVSPPGGLSLKEEYYSKHLFPALPDAPFTQIPNGYLSFYNGRSYYVPQGTKIHFSLTRQSYRFGWISVTASLDPLGLIWRGMLPARYTIAYGLANNFAVFSDTPPPENSYSGNNYGGFAGDAYPEKILTASQFSNIGANVGSAQDLNVLRALFGQ